MERFFHTLFLVFLSLHCFTSAQLNPAEIRVLFQLQQQLEFPPVLQAWNNWTNFCFLPPNPSLVVACEGTHITELTLIGNKVPTSKRNSSSTLSDKFSIDSFFTVLTKLSSLKKLTLVSLGLWGPMPPKISSLGSLEVLNMSSNSINGKIPTSISNIKNLTTLSLSNNLFNGSVPDLKGLQTLQFLDLGFNHLGPLWTPVSLSYNLVSIVLRNNSLRFETQPEFMKFVHLQTLDISSNSFVGPIPSSLFSLPSIQYLNLANNKFSGEIPSNISCNASNLEFLDVSNNLLIGKLPSCIESGSSNRTVMSSWNCLSNSTSKYQHPLKFCHKEALAVKPPVGGNSDKERESSTVKLGVVLGIIGGIVGIAGLIGLLILGIFRRAEARKTNEYRSDNFVLDKNAEAIAATTTTTTDIKRRPQTMRTAALGLPPYQVFTLEELEDATNNFDASNLVGEGSQGQQLYKAWLRDGTLVLVKCVKLKQKHSPQTLQQHMEVISKLRHRHLISILGHCIVTYTDHPNSGSTIFVVLEYIPNGSLKDHLTEWRKKEVLKWPHRMGITMGIARGIQFLHTGVQQGIFGNDLRIEHILLDDNLTAKISSYNVSLSSKGGPESPLNGQDASKRTQSAGNPEKDDIYQLGVILLQVITGKPISSNDEIDELKNQLEISLAESPARLKEATDTSIRGTFAYESLKTAVQIAMNCLNEDPSKRPSIEDVLWHMQYSVQVQEGWTSSGNLSTRM